MTKTKRLLALSLGLAVAMVSSAFAADKFSMKEVKVVDASNIVASFSSDLYTEGTNMFEFKLTQKDTKQEVGVKSVTLSGTTSVVLALSGSLTMDKEYDLVAVFVSDKSGNVIENGVDGLVSFVPNNVLASATTVAATTTSAPTDAAPAAPAMDSTTAAPADMNAAPTDGTAPVADLTAPTDAPADMNAASESGVVNPAELNSASGAAVVAQDATDLPKTGPQEVLLVLLAMVLGLGVFVARRKA